MSKKEDRKIEFYINDTRYKQIRIESNDVMWKNVPLVEDGIIASGLHIVDGHPERNHYDIYIGRKDINIDKPTQESLGNVLIDAKKEGIFAVPPNKIIVLTGRNGVTKFVTYDYYLLNKNEYDILLKNKDGFPCVIGLKKVDVESLTKP